MMEIQWNRVTWYSKLIAVVLFVGVFGLGFWLGSEYEAARMIPETAIIIPAASSTSETTIEPTTSSTAVQPNSSEKRFTAYITGYGWPDNTPPGGAISHGVIHSAAGGVGTYADPITVAVGHTLRGNTDILDYQDGTVFYMPYLHKYFIVEDTCGDGETPQNGPCHTGYEGHPWLDIWVGGEGAADAMVYACQEDITGLHEVIQNPGSRYAVVSGPVFNTKCATRYGESLIQ